jgi:hypothetical protein
MRLIQRELGMTLRMELMTALAGLGSYPQPETADIHSNIKQSRQRTNAKRVHRHSSEYCLGGIKVTTMLSDEACKLLELSEIFICMPCFAHCFLDFLCASSG